MALTITSNQYQGLEQYFGEVYNRSTEAQRAVRFLLTSFDGTVTVNGVELTQAQLDAREQKLKDDWAAAKAQLVNQIDAILGA